MASRHPLGQLIEDLKDANGWSDADIARQARKAGHDISKSRVAQLRGEPLKSISGDNLHALAAGLRVTPSLVGNVALASMGVTTYSPSSGVVEEAIRDDPSLDERGKEILLATLASVRTNRERRKTGGARTDGEVLGIVRRKRLDGQRSREDLGQEQDPDHRRAQ